MKTLFCLRHAKSSWAVPGQDDHDRPLTPRGVRAAELVALFLSQQPVPPVFALCSTARRAVDTLAPIRRHLGVPYETDRALYLADPTALLGRVALLDDAVSAALLVGHNPGMHDFALSLTGGGDRSARAKLRERFPTAALAVIELPITQWNEIAPGSGALVLYATPADLV